MDALDVVNYVLNILQTQKISFRGMNFTIWQWIMLCIVSTILVRFLFKLVADDGFM